MHSSIFGTAGRKFFAENHSPVPERSGKPTILCRPFDDSGAHVAAANDLKKFEGFLGCSIFLDGVAPLGDERRVGSGYQL
jgi:hypothetical protein